MPDRQDPARLFRSSDPDALYGQLLKDLESDKEAIPVITGPTASGKSSLAMRLAQERGGEIISCDAMQVYRGFDIGTAKPDTRDQLAVKHHMLDILDPCQTMTVASFSRQASDLIQELLDQGIKPILCGGSVQYVSALLDGLIFIDIPPDPALRRQIAQEIEARGLEASWRMIAQMDPQAARTMDPADRRRLGRFFEIYQQTGLTKTELNRRSRERGPAFLFRAFWLDRSPREALYQVINDRVETMWERGLKPEVKALMDRHPDYGSCPAFRGIGYREMVEHLEGRLDEGEAKALMARSTRRYAKRQQTWLRKRQDLRVLLYQLSE